MFEKNTIEEEKYSIFLFLRNQYPKFQCFQYINNAWILTKQGKIKAVALSSIKEKTD